MIFMPIFNFMEPAVSIIAQSIPMFRVLFIRVKRDTHKKSSRNSLTSRVEPTGAKSNSLENGTWDSKVPRHLDQNHGLLHVCVDPGGRIVRVH